MFVLAAFVTDPPMTGRVYDNGISAILAGEPQVDLETSAVEQMP